MLILYESLVECPTRQEHFVQYRAEYEQGNPNYLKWYPGKLFTLLVWDKYAPDTYWLYLSAPLTNSLLKLDSFLKAIWVECCGHLSEFEIGGRIYARYPDREYADRKERAMDGGKLEKVLQPGVEFSYIYDYGTSTELGLKVVAEEEGMVLSKRPDYGIMAHNRMPNIKCNICQQELATVVCARGTWTGKGEGYLCEQHAAEYGEEYEDYYLPVLNSPRTGHCGYDGTYTVSIKAWSKREAAAS